MKLLKAYVLTYLFILIAVGSVFYFKKWLVLQSDEVQSIATFLFVSIFISIPLSILFFMGFTDE